MSLYERGFEGESDQDYSSDNNSQPVDKKAEKAAKKAAEKAEKKARKMARKAAKKNNGGNKPMGFGKKLASAVALAASFGLVAGVTFQGSRIITDRVMGGNEFSGKAEISSKQITTGTGSLTSTGTSSATTVNDVSDIVKNVKPAIVQVTNMSVEEYQSFFGTFTKPSQSAGSGVIISQDADNIYVATNNHVVANTTSLTVTFSDDMAVTAEVVGTDEQTDLAVIKVPVSEIDEDTLKYIKVATLGSSDTLLVGESCVVIGNALGYGQSVTTGCISALNRDVTVQNESSGQEYTNKLVQVDAAVNPGNSGGALLNMNGEVVGIVSAKLSDTKVEGMGYAIPISAATNVITALMNGEEVDHTTASEDTDAKGGYLGILGMDVKSEYSMEYDMPEGVYVTRVIKDQPAAKAGIKKGDVIAKIDDVNVTSMAQLKTLMTKYKKGDEITAVVFTRANGYQESTVKITLADASEAPTISEKDIQEQENREKNKDTEKESTEDFLEKFFGGN